MHMLLVCFCNILWVHKWIVGWKPMATRLWRLSHVSVLKSWQPYPYSIFCLSYISTWCLWLEFFNVYIHDCEVKEWRKLHNEELHNLYSLQNIIRVIWSRRMRWVDHVVPMAKWETCTQFLPKTWKEKTIFHWSEDNTKMDLKQGVEVWLQLLAQDMV
jgi:hypothetical protein